MGPFGLRRFVFVVALHSVLCFSARGSSMLVARRDVPDWTHELLDGSSTQVSDARCNLASVRRANAQQLHGILSDLLNTTYFRLFRVNVDGECPLERKGATGSDKRVEKDEGECAGGLGGSPLFSEPACGVSTTNSAEDSVSAGKGDEDCESDECSPNSWIDPTTTEAEVAALNKQKNAEMDCDDENSPNFWLNMCEKLPTQPLEYVNLQLNEERHTGYNGSMIWEAIYTENCFKGSAPEDLCYEERVMYRLLSGLHASINTHISLNFHHPETPGGVWRPNPERFMKVLGNHPDRINNLHFAFVVLLRALRKATPVIRTKDYNLGDEVEDARTSALMEHLLDSHVLTSCSDVFEAFDESLLFQDDGYPSTLSSMKREFKTVFHNISEIFNCVKCRRCRLHGKMQLLGVGTALKILLLPDELITLSKDETVAFINTIGKFSESLESIPRLVQEYYWEVNEREQEKLVEHSEKDPGITSKAKGVVGERKVLSRSHKSLALATVAQAAQKQLISGAVEDALVDAALENEDLALIAEHFSHDLSKFVRHATRRFTATKGGTQTYDVVVVGAGLSGTTAALTLLDRGARVALIEKEGFIGGNSARASSGINGIDENSTRFNDSVQVYAQDILSGGGKNQDLANTLAQGSVDALEWLRTRVKIPLEEISRLGGHSNPRTHRPTNGLAGAELISSINKHLRPYVDSNRLKIFTNTKVLKLLLDETRVLGVVCEGGEVFQLRASNTVLATGGFAYDASPSGLLKRYRADLLRFGTTNGRFASGDGIKLAHDSLLKAKVIDMDSIQLHPTGFVDVNNRNAREKKLCAEMLRGVGAVLVDENGKRFANELGTRSYLTQSMLNLSRNVSQPEFSIILNRLAAEKADVHVTMYKKRKLLFQFETLAEVAQWMNVSLPVLRETLKEYDARKDNFGKRDFPSLPFLENGPYFVGKVTPVLHYCMGGLEINRLGQALREGDGQPIPGLYAVGEVVGGIHGTNRLGGNALTECVVFGRIVGNVIPISKSLGALGNELLRPPADETTIIHQEELQKHKGRDDCWVKLYSSVYNLTKFVDVHPAGPESILDLCGKDGTIEFEAIHSKEQLQGFEVVGEYATV